MVTDIKTMYDEIVALQPLNNSPILTPLPGSEEAERKKATDVDSSIGRFAGRVLSPSPTRIESITPGRIRGRTTYNTLSGQAFENGSSVNYCMLAVDYDISFDNSFDELVSLIHTGTLAQVGSEILTFSYERFDNSTSTHVPYPSYTFRIALTLHSLSPIKMHPVASTTV